MKDDPRIEVLLYVLVLAVGTIFAVWAYAQQAESISADLLLNLGSDLIAVTVVFLIFRTFRKRAAEESRERQAKSEELIQNTLEDVKSELVWRSAARPNWDRLEGQVVISDVHLDESTTPMRLLAKITNQSGRALELFDIRFSPGWLPFAAFSAEYARAGNSSLIIPVPGGKYVLSPGNSLPVELVLNSTWSEDEIKKGDFNFNWGQLYLYIEEMPGTYLRYGI